MSSIRQLQTTKQRGAFEVVTAPIPRPGPGEICVRPRAVSLNPIDWKNHQFGATVAQWPAVLGIEGAGVVESVGDGVGVTSSFAPGDEVMGWVNRTQFNGAWQDVYVSKALTVAKKPAGLTFEEAAAIPIAYLTGAAAVRVGLGVPLPGLSNNNSSSSPSLQSILVLGGSSGVGAAAIQLLRLALPSATIVATSSAAHHDKLRALGATACLERAAQQDPAALKAPTPGGRGADAIIDAVGASAQAPAVFDALRSDGPKLFSQVITGPGLALPEGVQASLIGGQDMVDREPDAMKYLTRLLEEGKYKLPVKVEVVGQGLEAIEPNLGKVMQTSGTKLVLKM
ncbi:GroES-like protein [Xylariaceae sp. FL0594]|nr:GroES-like protein [Xylariaceae sp. FL0594]